MNNYKTPEDFLLDETFVEWVEKTNLKSIEIWEERFRADPLQREMAEEAKTWMKRMQVKERLPAEQIERATARLSNTLTNRRETQIRRLPNYWKLSVAAIFLVVMSLSVFYFSGNTRPTIKTPYGQIAKQLLPDGTEITLNANSEIKYAKQWNDKEDREVWLNGEGLFHVKKTLSHSRFIVHTKDFDVIVIGTLFNVTDRTDVTNVVLKEGSVTIKDKSGQLKYLKPGDFIEYKNKSYTKKVVEPEAVVAWADQKLVFDKTPLTEVMKTIKEYYGVEVSVSDPSLENETISGVLPNDSLTVLINSLEATGVFAIKKEGNKLFINPAHKK